MDVPADPQMFPEPHEEVLRALKMAVQVAASGDSSIQAGLPSSKQPAAPLAAKTGTIDIKVLIYLTLLISYHQHKWKAISNTRGQSIDYLEWAVYFLCSALKSACLLCFLWWTKKWAGFLCFFRWTKKYAPLLYFLWWSKKCANNFHDNLTWEPIDNLPEKTEGISISMANAC